MTDNRQGGYGAVLKINVSGLTAVTHVVDFEFPEFEKILADITAHDSPGGYQEMIATGKRKMNSFTCKLTWDISETTHAAIVAAFDSDASVDMSVEDPNGDEVIAFDALVSKLGRIAEQEEGYSCEVEIQPTGIPTINGS
jgi:predicted secreted protein